MFYQLLLPTNIIFLQLFWLLLYLYMKVTNKVLFTFLFISRSRWFFFRQNRISMMLQTSMHLCRLDLLKCGIVSCKLYHTSSEGNSVIFLKDTIASSSASGSIVDFIFLSPIGRSFVSSRFLHLMMVLWFALNLIAAFAMPSSLLQISYGLPLLFWHLHVMLAP